MRRGILVCCNPRLIAGCFAMSSASVRSIVYVGSHHPFGAWRPSPVTRQSSDPTLARSQTQGSHRSQIAVPGVFRPNHLARCADADRPRLGICLQHICQCSLPPSSPTASFGGGLPRRALSRNRTAALHLHTFTWCSGPESGGRFTPDPAEFRLIHDSATQLRSLNPLGGPASVRRHRAKSLYSVMRG